MRTFPDASRRQADFQARTQTPFRLLLAWCFILVLAGCSPLARVGRHEAVFRPSAPASGTLASMEAYVAQGRRLAKKAPLEALGCYLAGAEQSAAVLRRDPSDKLALQAYNFSVARVLEVIQSNGLDPWNRTLQIPGPAKSYLLSYHASDNPRKDVNRDPSNYQLIPADTLQVGGEFFQTRSEAEGIGAALVAIGRHDAKDYKNQHLAKHIYGSITALVRFQGRRAEIELYEPLLSDTVVIDGHRLPLAADFTAPLSLLMTETHPQKLGLVRLLRPEHYRKTAALTRFQDYSPGKIPLVFIHGLDSTPATWIPMINALRQDGEIRRHYQVWVFSYPSGYAYPYSAALLRKEMDSMAKALPGHKPMVLIGHSMGSLISRLMITDVGDRLWLKYFGRPPEDTPFQGASAGILKDTLIFNSRADVSRSIFICGPHRGSEIASNWIGRLASRLIRIPNLAADIRDSVFSVMTLDPSALHLKTMPNSIDTLAPNNRFIKEINKIPIDPRIPYHSIIGDRGRGDTPNSSDGVVPYWSSHLSGAESELIVPHNHNSHHSPEAIAEVKRILRLHAGISSGKKTRTPASIRL